MRVNREVLRRRRVEAGFSLRGLAAAAGVSQETPMHIESGRQRPHPATLKKIADVLGVPVSELLAWDEDEPEGKAIASCARGDR